MKSIIRIVFSIALGTAILWFLFRDTDWKAVFLAISDANLALIFLSQVLAWAAYFTRVQRWGYVVRSSHPASYRGLFSATQIGFLVNFAVPARIGEPVRAYVLSKMERLSFSQSIAMVALDRIHDIIALLLVFYVAVASFPMDRQVTFAAGVFGNTEPVQIPADLVQSAAASLTLFLFASLVLLLLLYFKQDLAGRFITDWVGKISRKIAERLVGWLASFAAGMHVFRSSSDMAKSTVFSLSTWGADILSLAALLSAFSFAYPWYTPFLMLALISVCIAVPVTPGVVGQYHIAVMACLLMVMPEMDPNRARAAAITAHLLSLIPVAALGVFSLIRERLGFLNVVRVAGRSLDR